MRGSLASSAGAAWLAALALPLALPTGARAAPPASLAPVTAEDQGAAPAARAPGPAPGAGTTTGRSADTRPAAGAAPGPAALRPTGAAPGRTQSLPLAPLAADRALGSSTARGLTRRHVAPFALLGVVWDDPDAELDGRVQVRTRPAGASAWSPWRDIEASGEHAPDPGAAERTARRARGGTAPLWVGRSDGVAVRVIPSDGQNGQDGQDGGGSVSGPGPAAPGRRAAEPETGTGVRGSRTTDRTPATRPRHPGGGHPSALPHGLRLELVDPGAPSAAAGTVADAPAVANARLVPAGATVIPALDRDRTRARLVAAGAAGGARGAERGAQVAAAGTVNAPGAGRYVGARPAIVTRRGWGADESLREGGFGYTGPVKAAFVHHTDSGNDYTCAEAASVVRAVYRFHVKSMGWRDIGYNFLVDKCGTLYEGRAGGVERPVKGAHTKGFNNDSTGIAVIGTFTDTQPPAAAVDALAALSAWKLGLSGADPEGRTSLTSEGGNRYPKGQRATLQVVSGHRDGYATTCPGTLLYDRLGAVRRTAARLQGR